jgi:heme-degrading monooxygenase HmoA
MSYIKAYSQVVEAEVARNAWDETYFSLLSLKGHLQALPGWLSFDMWAHDLENGNIRLIAVTNWETVDHLSTWLNSAKTVDAILRAMEPPPKMLDIDLYEEIL